MITVRADDPASVSEAIRVIRAGGSVTSAADDRSKALVLAVVRNQNGLGVDTTDEHGPWAMEVVENLDTTE